MKRRVEINVDQLVLHGIPAGQRRAVEMALERDLANVAFQEGFASGRTPAIPPIRLPREGKAS